MSDTATTILVVDDDLFTAELTGMVMEMSGYEVIIAEGGLDALEKITENSAIRLIISDMNMPFLDGVQLFEELRRQEYRQPFVLLTGDNAEPLKTAHPNMDAILTKDEHMQTVLPELVETILART